MNWRRQANAVIYPTNEGDIFTYDGDRVRKMERKCTPEFVRGRILYRMPDDGRRWYSRLLPRWLCGIYARVTCFAFGHDLTLWYVFEAEPGVIDPGDRKCSMCCKPLTGREREDHGLYGPVQDTP